MAQTDRNFEIVVVADDCSDETSAVLQRANQAARVPLTIVECAEHSAARARNRGLAASSGQNCLFLDTDILVPREFTGTLRDAFGKQPLAVLLAPVYGNAASSLTWPFLVNDCAAVEMVQFPELLEWASHQPKLRDVRVPFADPETGSLDHLHAPWVFCWSGALAVRRSLIESAGGFEERFEVKGSEDIELGIRLSNAGAMFTLLKSYVFHLPHDRDRTREESEDFVHALRLLSMHTTVAVEALCAFDCANANPMLEMLGQLITRLSDVTWNAASRSARGNVLRLQSPDLVIGPQPCWSDFAPNNSCVVYPVPGRYPNQIPVFGFALPFEDKFFRVAVVACLWQILPERLACRLFDEALRVAQEVYVLKDSTLAISDVDISADQVAAYDTPYWERTHRLRRSFYDFRLVLLARDQEFCSYRLFPS